MTSPPTPPTPSPLPSPIRRALFVRGGALGDTLVTLPLLALLREKVDHLTFAGEPRYAALFPDLWDEVLDLRGPQTLWLFGAGPPPLPYDAALAFTPGVAATLRELGCPWVLGIDPRPPVGQRIDAHLWAQAAPLRPPAAPVPPRLCPDPAVAARIADRLGGRHPLVLAPSAGAADRRDNGLVALVDALQAAGHDPLWVPGRGEAAPAGTDAWTGLDLPALVALAAQCAGWIGADTGTTHLAAAAGAPVLLRWSAPHSPAWAPAGATLAPMDAPPARVLAWADAQRGGYSRPPLAPREPP